MMPIDRDALPTMRLLLCAISLVALSGCTEEPDGSEWAGTGGLEFDIERVSMQVQTIDGSCDGLVGHFRTDSSSIYGSAVLEYENGAVSRRDVYTAHPTPISAGTEVCLQSGVVGGEWSTPECLTIENESYPYSYSTLVYEGACSFYLSAPILVERFDSREYCESTCGHNTGCGRVVEGDCLEDCLDAIEGSPADEAPSCHYATRDAYDCMYWSSCDVKNGFEDRCLIELANGAFDEPSCEQPEIPVGFPDPLACDPAPLDLVAGGIDDFAKISVTTDYPGQYYYLLLDLTQLAEIDAEISEDPGSTALQLAAAVSRDLKAMDQGPSDMCEDPNTLAILFDPPFDPRQLGDLDTHFRTLQTLLDQLDDLRDAAKQAVVDEIMNLYCDGLTEIFGDFFGYLIQVQQGCWDDA